MATTKKTASGSSLEAAVVETFPFLIDAIGVAALGLLVPNDNWLRGRFLVQLGLLSLFAVFLTFRLLGYLDTIWFDRKAMRHPLRFQRRVLATGLSTIVIVTGTVGLATLASSAALRYQPSTQFLQLLSALDIAWAVATVMVAAYWLWGRRYAVAGGLAVVAVCLWAIWRYLDNVGFGPNGGWRLRAAPLWEYVLIYDMAIAVIAIGLLWLAIRRRSALG